MRVISAPEELKSLIKSVRLKDYSIGFVPTMGAIHDGHIRLVEKAKETNEVIVVSIFVNPLQFDNSEDLEKYPRTMNEDLDKLKKLEVDYVFTPSEKDLYPTRPSISINFGAMSKKMEGKYREGHFEGVGVVVSKLLHLVGPTDAYFGLKDLQQFLLIRKMCSDLDFPVTIHGIETVRESSGLAMSSRNKRLTSEGLEIASKIYQGLKLIGSGIEKGKDLDQMKMELDTYYKSVDGLEVEYLEFVEPETLNDLRSVSQINELAVCFAGYVEGIRLIDNLYLRLK